MPIGKGRRHIWNVKRLDFCLFYVIIKGLTEMADIKVSRQPSGI
jgi:hypothetical protein